MKESYEWKTTSTWLDRDKFVGEGDFWKLIEKRDRKYDWNIRSIQYSSPKVWIREIYSPFVLIKSERRKKKWKFWRISTHLENTNISRERFHKFQNTDWFIAKNRPDPTSATIRQTRFDYFNSLFAFVQLKFVSYSLVIMILHARSSIFQPTRNRKRVH